MNEYKFRDNRIICIGDTHCMDILFDHLLHKIPENSNVWMCGDLGIGFGDISYAVDNAKSYLMRFNALCLDKNINFYISRGNHDAPYPSIWDTEWSNVFLVRTGDVGIFPNGKRTLFINGGISVDRYNRKEGVSYWTDEITENLENVPKTDFVFSHDAPAEFNHSTESLPKKYGWYVDIDPTLMEDSHKQRNNITRICRESGARFILSGHFHNSSQEKLDNVSYRCLDINELWEFDSEKY